MSLNSGRTAQYKRKAQFLRHFCLHDDVNDAHRAGANRLKKQNNKWQNRHVEQHQYSTAESVSKANRFQAISNQ